MKAGKKLAMSASAGLIELSEQTCWKIFFFKCLHWNWTLLGEHANEQELSKNAIALDKD